MRDRRRFVIVGGGLAGGRAAEALREFGFEGELTLLTEEPRLPHERPPLSKEYLTGRLAAERLLTRPATFYSDHRIAVWTGSRVEAVDPERSRVLLGGGEELPYHRLLLAPGAAPVRAEIPGAGLPGVTTLRSVEDADTVRDELGRGAPVLVLGGGFLGSEVAAAARQAGCEVELVEMATALLAPMGRRVGELALAAHLGHGVGVALGVSVARFVGTARLEGAVLDDGRELECRLAVVCVGARPRLELARSAQLRTGAGILVDPQGRSSRPEILVAGDAAEFWHPGLGRRLRLEHWDNAQRQGRHAAAAMLGSEEPYLPIPYFWTELYGTLVQMVGLWERGRTEVLRGDPGRGRFSVFQQEAGRVVACVAVNRYPDLKRARLLIASGKPVDPDRLSDLGVDLGSLSGAGPLPG